ncbi:Metal-dependent hydrolase YbeY, involved in rRNA and/or ribosome maturation and assembly [Brevinematales bacterium NS]|nr:rRNA maturation RNase YbeY [Brevinematales bacterium]QJR21034.1 Metal-dependent hydrolase YbeY, involved in rRNA and/or ribosome maturation and assembly [Brevinematales bacterium NS]
MIEIRNEQEIFDNPLFFDRLTQLIRKILGDHQASQYGLSLLLCDNPTIQELNALYRGKDYATDVLSFSLTEGEALEDFSQMAMEDENGEIYEMLGDIVISTEKAQSQAKENHLSWEGEIARLTIHGTLHLLGYDHEKGEKEEEEMFEKQDAYLEWFLARYPEYTTEDGSIPPEPPSRAQDTTS